MTDKIKFKRFIGCKFPEAETTPRTFADNEKEIIHNAAIIEHLEDTIVPQPGSPSQKRLEFLRYVVQIKSSNQFFNPSLHVEFQWRQENRAMLVGPFYDCLKESRNSSEFYRWLRLKRREAWWFGLPWGEDNIDKDLGL